MTDEEYQRAAAPVYEILAMLNRQHEAACKPYYEALARLHNSRTPSLVVRMDQIGTLTNMLVYDTNSTGEQQ